MATRDEPSIEAIAGLQLDDKYALRGSSAGAITSQLICLSRLQERFRSYWGIEFDRLAALRYAVTDSNPDVLISVGLAGLPYLAAGEGTMRIWYAADEWFVHHFSLLKLTDPATWKNINAAIVKLAYERAYSSLVHRSWLVSTVDKNAMRFVAGMRNVDVVPNGVDTAFYAPFDTNKQPHSCVFSGRLDFEPTSWKTKLRSCPM